MSRTKTVEVAIESGIESGRVVTINGDVRDIFAVIKAMRDTGHNPQVRYEDDEVGGKTCWLPTQRVA